MLTMIKRALIWLTLGLAGLCIVFAAMLMQPADIWEMLVGFAAGTLGAMQWMVLGVAITLLVAAVLVDRPVTSLARRRLAVALAASAAIIAVAVISRDNRSMVRDTVSIHASNVALQGTLYRPRSTATAQRPALLLLHGSGPTRRDAYHLFARRFVSLGFIVLNVDKRGVGGSGGRYHGDNLAEPVIETRIADSRVAASITSMCGGE